MFLGFLALEILRGGKKKGITGVRCWPAVIAKGKSGNTFLGWLHPEESSPVPAAAQQHQEHPGPAAVALWQLLCRWQQEKGGFQWSQTNAFWKCLFHA